MSRSRAGFGGRSRSIEGDAVRGRRTPQKFPVGPGLAFDGHGRLVLETTGALTTKNGMLELEVEPPLAQSSPLRIKVDTETVEFRNGVLTAKQTLEAGDGIKIERGRIVNDATVAVSTGLQATTTREGTQRTVTISRVAGDAIAHLDGGAVLADVVSKVNEILSALEAQGIIASE